MTWLVHIQYYCNLHVFKVTFTQKPKYTTLYWDVLRASRMSCILCSFPNHGSRSGYSSFSCVVLSLFSPRRIPVFPAWSHLSYPHAGFPFWIGSFSFCQCWKMLYWIDLIWLCKNAIYVPVLSLFYISYKYKYKFQLASATTINYVLNLCWTKKIIYIVPSHYHCRMNPRQGISPKHIKFRPRQRIRNPPQRNEEPSAAGTNPRQRNEEPYAAVFSRFLPILYYLLGSVPGPDCILNIYWFSF